MTTQDVNPAASISVQEPHTSAPVRRNEHREDSLTRVIEQQAAKIPSAFFLISALGALGLSVAFELAGKPRASRFVGIWAPTLLITGVYNKLVKTLGPR